MSKDRLSTHGVRPRRNFERTNAQQRRAHELERQAWCRGLKLRRRLEGGWLIDGHEERFANLEEVDAFLTNYHLRVVTS